MATLDREALLAMAPPAAALASAVLGADVEARRNAFCASAAIVGVMVVAGRLTPRLLPRCRRRTALVIRALVLEAIGGLGAAACFAADPAVPGSSASGLRVAGLVSLALCVVLIVPGLPTPGGMLALELLSGGASDRRQWGRRLARAVGLRALLIAPLVWLHPSFGLAAALGVALLWGWSAEREERRRRLRNLGLSVAELADPVTELAPASETPVDDLARLKKFRYGVVRNATGDAMRLVTLDRVRDVGAAGVMTGRWWRLGISAPVVDGAQLIGEIEHLPRGDQVWLVSAGDLVIGVLTARALRRAADSAHAVSADRKALR
jgi:hypothetical protein